MTTTGTQQVLTAPLAVTLPAIPAGEVLTQDQWGTLLALLDAIVPSIRCEDSLPASLPEHAGNSTIYLSKDEYESKLTEIRRHAAPTAEPKAQNDLIEEFLATKMSDNPLSKELLHSIISRLPPSKKKMLEMVLYLLGTMGGSLILTGYTTTVAQLPVTERAKVIHGWRTSSFYALRGLFKTITTLGKLVYLRTHDVLYHITGFPHVPTDWVHTPDSFPYQFLQPQPPSSKGGVVEIDTDVVIVGSGCGAGVTAWRLAKQFGPSLRVLVVEKGRHYDNSYYPMKNMYGLSNLFEAGGVIESDDGSITVTAGATFGGGGTVNWSAALQTQHFVRKEWADRGLPFFESPAFQACLDRVCDQMGVSGTVLTPNHGNKVLLEGARKLGYDHKIVPQNTKRSAHDCGYCTLGCFKGEKQGPVNGWFPEAAKNGTKFMQGMKVDKVVFKTDKNGKKVAKGVKGTWTPVDGNGDGIKVKINAKKVIVSCGTLWSPVVLQNSGLKNANIGKNLYLHPTVIHAAVFEHETKPWEGGTLTSVVGSFENLDGKGHGVKLECMNMMPSLCMPFFNWNSGLDYKMKVAKYRHLNKYIAIARERDPGYIYRDADTGEPAVNYTPSVQAREHLLEGTLQLSRLLYIQGAKEIHVSLPGFGPFVREGSTQLSEMEDIIDPKFLQWLADLKAHGNRTPETPIGSAHQMGTCRMSAAERDGVVDPRGKVWGTEGLYVADASVFPSASGVNPMVTVMAIADWIAMGICKDLQAEGVVGSGASTARL